MRHLIALLCSIGIPLLLTGCGSTRQQLQLQEELRLRTQFDALTSLERVLETADDDRLVGSQSSVFVSDELIDGLLMAADGISFPAPGLDDVEIHVERVRTEFTTAVPRLRLEATASHSGLRVSLELSILAMLALEVDPADTRDALLKIYVEDMVPIAKWGPFSGKVRGFVRNLLAVEAQRLADELPTVTIPLRQEVDVNVPAATRQVSMPMGSGELAGNLAIAGFDTAFVVRANHVVFLEDGLHLFLAVE